MTHVAWITRSELLRIRSTKAQTWLLAAFAAAALIWSWSSSSTWAHPASTYFYGAYLHLPDLALLSLMAGIYAAVEPGRDASAIAHLIEPRRVRLALTRLASAGAIGLGYAVLGLIAATIAAIAQPHPAPNPLSGAAPWGQAYHLAWSLLIAFPACAIIGCAAGLLIRSISAALTTLIPIGAIMLLAPSNIFSLSEPKFCEFLLGSAVDIATHTNNTTYGGFPDFAPGVNMYLIGPPPHVGVLILLGYTVILSALAIWVVRRRDVV